MALKFMKSSCKFLAAEFSKRFYHLPIVDKQQNKNLDQFQLRWFNLPTILNETRLRDSFVAKLE